MTKLFDSGDVEKETTFSNGTVLTVYRNGKRVQVDQEGVSITTLADGTLIQFNPNNGMRLTKYMDGTKLQENDDGSKVSHCD